MTLPCAVVAPGWPQTRLAERSRRESNWWNPSSESSRSSRDCEGSCCVGLGNVAAEWTLLATAFNLRTLWRVWRTRRPDCPVPRGVNRAHPIVAQTTANLLYCLPNPLYAHSQ